MFDVDYDVERLNSVKACGECIFCLTKCPKCGSVKILVQYQKQYYEDGNLDSVALVGCECGRTVLETIEMPLSIGHDGDGNPVTIENAEQEYIESPDLKECLDKVFEKYKPREPANVRVIYTYENDTEDQIELSCDQIEPAVEFNEGLPSSIVYRGKKENDKHYEITETVYSIL